MHGKSSKTHQKVKRFHWVPFFFWEAKHHCKQLQMIIAAAATSTTSMTNPTNAAIMTVTEASVHHQTMNVSSSCSPEESDGELYYNHETPAPIVHVDDDEHTTQATRNQRAHVRQETTRTDEESSTTSSCVSRLPSVLLDPPAMIPATSSEQDARLPWAVSQEKNNYDGDDESESDNDIISIKKKIGDAFSQREFVFVLSVGILLSFNGGYVNGSCLSGLLTVHGVTQSVASLTRVYTNSVLALAEGSVDYFFFEMCMIMSFMVGACISGIITPDATPFHLEPTYGPTFMAGAILLAIASALAAADDEDYFFFFVAAANGVQNGMSSIYSANLIRSTHLTGTSTDIGVFLGQILRGHRKNVWKLSVLLSLTASFWIGSFLSFYATTHFSHYSLLFNASLFMVIGIALCRNFLTSWLAKTRRPSLISG